MNGVDEIPCRKYLSFVRSTVSQEKKEEEEKKKGTSKVWAFAKLRRFLLKGVVAKFSSKERKKEKKNRELTGNAIRRHNVVAIQRTCRTCVRIFFFFSFGRRDSNGVLITLLQLADLFFERPSKNHRFNQPIKRHRSLYRETCKRNT